MNVLAAIGRITMDALARSAGLSLFLWSAVTGVIRPPFYWRLIGGQMLRIGYYSLPVVGLTAFFTGMVLALQIYTGSARFGAEASCRRSSCSAITRELGPVLAGLMVAGRVGAAIAAEIGTMRVTEQIDALTTLSTNPFKYLVAPRLIAARDDAACWSSSPTSSASSAAMSSSTRAWASTGRVYLKNTLDFLDQSTTSSPAWSRPPCSASSSR